MTPNYYDIDQMVRFSALFKVAGVPTDPTTIILKLKNLSDVVIPYTYALGELTKSGTGAYYKDVKLNKIGEWFYRFEGTGTVEAVEEAYCVVEDSEF